MLVPIVDDLLFLSICALAPECLYLFLVCGRDTLKLPLNRIIKLLFVSSDLSNLEVLNPSLKH